MSTQGEDVAAALVGIGIALNNIAAAIQKTPRRPGSIAEDPEWPARTPGKHTPTAPEGGFVDIDESVSVGPHLRWGGQAPVTRDLLAEVVRDIGSALRENSANSAADRLERIADGLQSPVQE